jgi:hypothetical protein
MEALGVVEVTRTGTRNLHHLRGHSTARGAMQNMELRRPECCQLYEWLRKAGPSGLVQQRVLDYAQQSWGWSRSKTWRLIERLRDVGIAAWNDFGLLYALEPAPGELTEDPATVAAEQTALLQSTESPRMAQSAARRNEAHESALQSPPSVAPDDVLLEALQVPAGHEDGWTPPHASPWTRPRRHSFVWCYQKCRYESTREQQQQRLQD